MSFVYRGRNKSFAEVDLKSRVEKRVRPTCPPRALSLDNLDAKEPPHEGMMMDELSRKSDIATNTLGLMSGDKTDMNSMEYLEYRLTFRYRSEVLL